MNVLGKLSWNAIPHDAVSLGGVAVMMLVGLLAVGAMFYFKRWTWLWREWLTSLDPKRIGVMYLVVALVMLLRGVADAALIRTQQATSVGSSHGILSSDHFQQIFSAHG